MGPPPRVGVAGPSGPPKGGGKKPDRLTGSVGNKQAPGKAPVPTSGRGKAPVPPPVKTIGRNNVAGRPGTERAQTAGRSSAPTPLPTNPIKRSDTIRVSLRKTSESSCDRQELYKILFMSDIDVRHVYTVPTGFSVIADNPGAVEKILGSNMATKLAAVNLKPLPPPELLARRTVVVRGVDEMVGSHSAESIKHEINRNNQGITVENVIKIPNRQRFFKIVLADTNSAERVCREGFRAFYYKVRADQISQETFVSLKVCFKCYKYNDHATNQCESKTVVCSECAETGHTYRDCKSRVKRCVNCKKTGGDSSHRTLAAKCPLRKKLINDKKSQINNVNSTKKATYANVAKANNEPKRKSQEPLNFPQIKLDSNISIKMTALVIEAHIASLTRKEKFSTYLAENMKLNYGIDVKFPERNSEEIFRMLSNPEQPVVSDPATQEPASQEPETQEPAEDSIASGDESEPSRGQKNKRLTTSSTDTEDGEQVITQKKRRKRRGKRFAPRSGNLSSDNSNDELPLSKLGVKLFITNEGYMEFAQKYSGGDIFNNPLRDQGLIKLQFAGDKKTRNKALNQIWQVQIQRTANLHLLKRRF